MLCRSFAVSALAALAACGSQGSVAPPAEGLTGSSIALVAHGALLAVTNPDHGSVSLLDPGSLGVVATVEVGGEPHALLELPSGEVLVANYRGGELVEIDVASRKVSRRSSVCHGAWGLAAPADGSRVFVSCEWDQVVKKVDPATLAGTTLGPGLHRPRAIAVLGSDVIVADYVGGLVHQLSPSGADSPTSLVPANAPYRPALTEMSANLAAAVVPASGAVHVAHVLENHTGLTSEPVADDYGTVLDTKPKINPAVTTLGASTPVLYASYGDAHKVYSGPVGAAAFGSRYLLVAHVSTGNVAVLDLSATDPDARAVATYQVGFGPTGIAVDAANAVAYVDNALDESVSRIDLSVAFAPGAPVYAADATRVRELPSRYSTAALAGRQLFFDATNTHVTPSGVVACASCHPGGSDDGLVWLEHSPNIPYRHRRTPHLGNAKSATAPFHWDGQFRTMSELVVSTIQNVMGGDALLVDGSTVQAYIDEAILAPVLPATDAPAVLRGKQIFETAEGGCARCHAGEILTDDKMHAVLDPMSLNRKDGIHTANTPGLHGIFLAAPYFHDGRAATLDDVLTRKDASLMGNAHNLDASQRADLIAYLRTL